MDGWIEICMHGLENRMENRIKNELKNGRMDGFMTSNIFE